MASFLDGGQALELMTVVMVGLLVMAGLAFDGGMIYVERRRMQNAADADALEGTRLLFRWQIRTDCPDYSSGEQALLSAVHTMAEANGVEDTDGAPGNAVNDNANAYYVDHRGVRLSETPIGAAGSTAVCLDNKCVPQGPGKCCGVEAMVCSEVGTTLVRLAGPSLSQVEAAATGAYEAEGGFWGSAVVWADSPNCEKTIDWSGSVTTIASGDIHSNRDIYVGGSSNTVGGRSEYVNQCSLEGSDNNFNCIQLDEPTPLEPLWNIDDFAPGGYIANKAIDNTFCGGSSDYTYHSGDWTDFDQYDHICGVHFVEGKVDMGASDLWGTVTIVSRGIEIKLGGSDHDLEPYPHAGEILPLLFSGYKYSNSDDQCVKPVIMMSGSNHNWAGFVYAPDAQIEMSGSSNTTYSGALIGWTVKLNGSDLYLESASESSPTTLVGITLIR